MKSIQYSKLLLFATMLTITISCKKVTLPPYGSVATLNIVDALPTSTALIPVQGTTGPVYTDKVPGTTQYGYYQNFTNAPTVTYGSTFLINPQAGNLQVYLVQKNADTLMSGGHVAKTMFNQSLNLQANNVYSLFIAGHDTTTADYVLVQDQLSAHRDSTCGVRFINLSANSNPVSVDIKGQPNGSEVQTLSYKGYTGFKTYAATAAISSYVFEFRDASSGTLLATYTLSGVNYSTGTNTTANNVRFKNLTIALIGQPGGTGANAQKTILENNF